MYCPCSQFSPLVSISVSPHQLDLCSPLLPVNLLGQCKLVDKRSTRVRKFISSFQIRYLWLLCTIQQPVDVLCQENSLTRQLLVSFVVRNDLRLFIVFQRAWLTTNLVPTFERREKRIEPYVVQTGECSPHI